jgi:hypothetical protein
MVMFKRAVAAGAVAVAGLAAAAPAASAAAVNGNGDLYSNNSFCNGAQNKTAGNDVGFVTVHKSQDGGTVSVNYHLKDAKPGATYTVYLYTGFCAFDAVLGTVTVNDHGVGNGNFQDVTVPAGTTQVFTYSFDSPFTQTIESEAVALS